VEKIKKDDIHNLIKTALKKPLYNKEDIEKLKRVLAKSSGVSNPVSSSVIVRQYEDLVKKGEVPRNRTFERLIRKKAIRTSSGVAPVAILTKPYPCPGQCIYCPSEQAMPKSYLSNEPAAMRAINNNFDPYRQVKNRLLQYKNIGHATDKVEVIILGGTFSAYPKFYQEEFIKNVFDACNPRPSRDLKEAQIINEQAKYRIVCLSIETRPDMVDEKEIRFLRSLGVTKIQLGVQTTHNHILEHVKRGHQTEQSIKATQLLKDAGFKLCYHMMVNLPRSTPELDLKAHREIFTNPDYKPDGLKIYPCVVLEGTELCKQWHLGAYKPYSDRVLSDLLLAIKEWVPEFIRIDRIYRDIPKESIAAGSILSNIRQVLKSEMEEQRIKCQCIRCREIKTKEYSEDLKYKVNEYRASGGKEFFLSFTDKNNMLYALLRLRIPSQLSKKSKHFISELEDAAIIREIRTYGVSLGVGGKPLRETQHRGLGASLIEKAEEITRGISVKRLAIISGVGVRGYFRKFGYELEDTYMIKEL